MTLAQILSMYLTVNLLVVVAFLSLRILSRAMENAGTELRLHYGFLIALIGLSCLHPIFPKSDVVSPAAKIWSAQSIVRVPEAKVLPREGGYLTSPAISSRNGIDTDILSTILFVIAFVVFSAGALRLGRDVRSLLKIRGRSFRVRKVGRTTIFLNEEIRVPFSYWLPFHVGVVIPSRLLEKPSDYRMAVAHELQHHRQADTKWIFVLWALRILCLFNPFIHLWSRWISELQEFACDETLVDRRKVESRQYARCLVEVAETAIHQKYVPACATGLVFLVERNLLKRRIERMITQKRQNGRPMALVIALITFTLMTGVAYATKGLIQDRRVTQGDAERMAAKIPRDSEFPIVINDQVLTWLNWFVGTPEGRERMRTSLQRMEGYRSIIEPKLKEYSVPQELMALPITESGYKNNVVSSAGSAGIWQFMAETARILGVKVNSQVDERYNVPILTDAAMRLLKSNQLRFKDWHLSLLAYNAGEHKLQSAMRKTGSRDPWVIIRDGLESKENKDYLPKLLAAVLVMNNPETLD